MSSAGEALNNGARGFVPLVAETEYALNAVGVEIMRQGGGAPLATMGAGAAFYAAKAVPVVGASAWLGAGAGGYYEEAAASMGWSKPAQKATGLGGAILTGAAVGAIAGSPVGGIGAVPGLIIGGIAGGVAYAWTH